MIQAIFNIYKIHTMYVGIVFIFLLCRCNFSIKHDMHTGEQEQYQNTSNHKTYVRKDLTQEHVSLIKLGIIKPTHNRGHSNIDDIRYFLEKTVFSDFVTNQQEKSLVNAYIGLLLKNLDFAKNHAYKAIISNNNIYDTLLFIVKLSSHSEEYHPNFKVLHKFTQWMYLKKVAEEFNNNIVLQCDDLDIQGIDIQKIDVNCFASRCLQVMQGNSHTNNLHNGILQHYFSTCLTSRSQVASLVKTVVQNTKKKFDIRIHKAQDRIQALLDGFARSSDKTYFLQLADELISLIRQYYYPKYTNLEKILFCTVCKENHACSQSKRTLRNRYCGICNQNVDCTKKYLYCAYSKACEYDPNVQNKSSICNSCLNDNFLVSKEIFCKCGYYLVETLAECLAGKVDTAVKCDVCDFDLYGENTVFTCARQASYRGRKISSEVSEKHEKFGSKLCKFCYQVSIQRVPDQRSDNLFISDLSKTDANGEFSQDRCMSFINKSNETIESREHVKPFLPEHTRVCPNI